MALPLETASASLRLSTAPQYLLLPCTAFVYPSSRTARARDCPCRERGSAPAQAATTNAGSRTGNAPAPAAMRAGEAQALVVARLDLPAASAAEAAELVERARHEGWNLLALDLGLDLATPAGRRIAKAFTTVAGWERRLRSERAR